MLIIETQLEGEGWKKQGELNIKRLQVPMGSNALAMMCAHVLLQECRPNSVAVAGIDSLSQPPIKKRGVVRATLDGREILLFSDTAVEAMFV